MIAVTSRIPPLIDFSADFEMQTVIASGKSSYQGHPTTLQMPDGTILCTWTIGHGGTCGPMAKSSDGGRTWHEVATPGKLEELHQLPDPLAPAGSGKSGTDGGFRSGTGIPAHCGLVF